MKPDKSIGYIINETATTVSTVEPAKIIKTDKNNRRVIAEGVLQEADETNRNGRWYESSDLFPQLTCNRTIELLKSGNLRAENGHPLSKELVRQQTIDPEKTVAIFTKLWTEGPFVKAYFRGTNDKRGEEFNQDLLDGFSPSWSLRALGRIVQDPKKGAIVKGIKVITWDRVIYPSHSKAYTTGIITESGILQNTNESALYINNDDRGMITPITNKSVINYIKSESANYKQIRECFDLIYDDITLLGNSSQVKLTDVAGNIMVVNLEEYIHDEIMNACFDRIK